MLKNNSTNRQFFINQPHYSEDEENFRPNQQQFKTNQRKNQCYNIDQPDDFFQPDVFEPHMKPHSYNLQVKTCNNLQEKTL